MKKKISFLIMIMIILMFTANCTENNQNEEPDPSINPETLILEEAEEVMDEMVDEDQSVESKEVLSEEETEERMDETLNTLYELEKTINSLDEVSDSDLQLPE